jgi:hypothetical protein
LAGLKRGLGGSRVLLHDIARQMELRGGRLAYREGSSRRLVGASLDDANTSGHRVGLSIRLRAKFAENCAKSGPIATPRFGEGGGPNLCGSGS